MYGTPIPPKEDNTLMYVVIGLSVLAITTAGGYFGYTYIKKKDLFNNGTKSGNTGGPVSGSGGGGPVSGSGGGGLVSGSDGGGLVSGSDGGGLVSGVGNVDSIINNGENALKYLDRFQLEPNGLEGGLLETIYHKQKLPDDKENAPKWGLPNCGVGMIVGKDVDGNPTLRSENSDDNTWQFINSEDPTKEGPIAFGDTVQLKLASAEPGNSVSVAEFVSGVVESCVIHNNTNLLMMGIKNIKGKPKQFNKQLQNYRKKIDFTIESDIGMEGGFINLNNNIKLICNESGENTKYFGLVEGLVYNDSEKARKRRQSQESEENANNIGLKGPDDLNNFTSGGNVFTSTSTDPDKGLTPKHFPVVKTSKEYFWKIKKM